MEQVLYGIDYIEYYFYYISYMVYSTERKKNVDTKRLMTNTMKICYLSL